MTRGRHASGVQMTMFGDSDALSAAWTNERTLKNELACFSERLAQQHGLADSTAGVQSRHLASMVRFTSSGTVARFLRAPKATVAEVRRATREGTRRGRHLAVLNYAEICADSLPLGTLQSLDAEFDRLPGRVSPAPHLVDRSLGGSKKQRRPRTVFLWDDGERLMRWSAPAAGERSANLVRDHALVSIHVRSSLAPEETRGLDWAQVLPVLTSASEVEWLLLGNGHHRRAVHLAAIQALRVLHVAVGEPRLGPVFSAVGRPGSALSASGIVNTLRRATMAVGFPTVDRRHLRAPFGVWLLQRGWDEITVRDAMGYGRVRDLRAALRPVEEVLAQIRSREVLVLPGRALAADRSRPIRAPAGEPACATPSRANGIHSS